jgi:hypothetical protein
MDAKGKEESEDSSDEEVPEISLGGEAVPPAVETALVNPIQTCMGPIGEYVAEVENCPPYPTIASFGARRSGKSTSFANYMKECFGHYAFGLVLTRTKSNGFWQQYVPERFVIQLDDTFRVDILEALMERQERLIAKYGADSPLVPCFCILDDVIADQKAIRYTPQLNTFFTEGRHKKVAVAITSQYIKGIGPMLRTNCDLMFIQPIYNRNERDALYELVGPSMTRREWHSFMDDILCSKKLPGHTSAHPRKEVRIMVIENFEQTPDVSERVYWWKPLPAEQLEPYRLCHPDYWKESNYSSRDDEGLSGDGKDAKASLGEVFDKYRTALTKG